MTTTNIADEAESIVRQLAIALLEPAPGECLCCFVDRQLDAIPCNGTHRHAMRFRDATAPRATALKERLSRLGACCCDCELFMNGYVPQAALSPSGDLLDVEEVPLPPCAGVRRGSVTPCANWVRIRRRRRRFG